MRIALISDHASPLAALGGVDAGGQNIYVAHVARRLAGWGHVVDVYTRRDDPMQPAVVDVAPRMRVLNVPAGPPRFVPKEQLLDHMPAFAAFCERQCTQGRGYDIVHANFFMSGWVALQLKRRLGLPFVITFHALGLVRLEHQRDADTFPQDRIAIERALVDEADGIIAECPQDRVDLVRLYGADASRMSMVPCGYDPDEFAPMDRALARRRLGLPADAFVVLQLGRLVPRKGIDNVVRAMPFLPRRIKPLLVVVGGASDPPDEALTPEIARLRCIAREAGVQDRVRFEGCKARHELRDYYAAANVFASTPWYEPFGITPLEAMACATPVIGSAVGGIQYSVLDGVTGFLVPPNDPAALAERLSRLAADPALAEGLGAAGLQRAREFFTWECVTQQLLAAYDGLPEVRTPSSRRSSRRMPARAAPHVRRETALSSTR